VLEPSRLVGHTMRRDTENEPLPTCLEAVAGAFEKLRERLHEFHEYTVRSLHRSLILHSIIPHQDESADIKNLMQLFANDLKVRPCMFSITS
jgi:hypothetical protein